MTNYYFRVLLTLLAACTLYFSCAASPKKGAMRKMLTSQKDNGYGKVINDSIVAIIFDAKKVTCELQSKNHLYGWAPFFLLSLFSFFATTG